MNHGIFAPCKQYPAPFLKLDTRGQKNPDVYVSIKVFLIMKSSIVKRFDEHGFEFCS